MTVIVKDDSGGCQVNDAARHALAHSGGEGAGNIRARPAAMPVAAVAMSAPLPSGGSDGSVGGGWGCGSLA